MMLKADQQRVKALLTETVTLLCKNGLHFKSEFSIEGLIAITLDQQDIFVVSIKETVKLDKAAAADGGRDSNPPSPGELSSTTRKRRTKPSAVESATRTASDSTLPSLKAPATAAQESFTASHPDNSSASDRLSTSPLDSASAKRQSDESAQIIRFSGTSPPPPSVLGKPSDENASSDRIISFYDVPIKLDYELGSQSDSAGTSQTQESRRSMEPPAKRPRHQPSDQVTEPLRRQDDNSTESFSGVPPASSSYKMEPSEIIEIKEESLSDDEAKDSMAGYSSYVDYGGTAAYGDADVSQMYGESSGFQAETMFQGDMQGNIATRSHELLHLNHSIDNDQGRWQQQDNPTGNIVCKQCGTAFKNYRNLTMHEKRTHLGLYPYVCQICGKGTKTKSDLRGHMASKHNGPRDFCCPTCGQEFAYKCHLKTHMLSIHGIGF